MRKINAWKAERMLANGCHLPRKVKKAVLGNRINKAKLRKKLASIQIIPQKYPLPYRILPESFCPKCGCTKTRSTGNMASYPELYEKTYCLRCGYLVEMADNSPSMNCLEWPDHSIDM